MSPDPLISISIVSHKQAEMVKHLLQDLQKFCPDRIEVILTINHKEILPFQLQQFHFPLYCVINEKQKEHKKFERQLWWQNGGWQLEDTLQAPSWDPVQVAGIGPDQTSIYVVMSRTFKIGQLQPWLDMT